MLVIQSAKSERNPHDLLRGTIRLAPFYDGDIVQLADDALQAEAEALRIGIEKRCRGLVEEHAEFIIAVDRDRGEILLELGKTFPDSVVTMIQQASQQLAYQHERGGHDTFLLRKAGEQLAAEAVNMVDSVTAELRACNLVIDY